MTLPSRVPVFSAVPAAATAGAVGAAGLLATGIAMCNIFVIATPDVSVAGLYR